MSVTFFLAECRWVWVSVTYFWLGVGECDLFWLGVSKCGWVWVGVGECTVYNYP